MKRRHIVVVSRLKRPAGFLWKAVCWISITPFAMMPWVWRFLLFLIRLFRKERPSITVLSIGDLVWHDGDRYTIVHLDVTTETDGGIPEPLATICLESNPSDRQTVRARTLEKLTSDARHEHLAKHVFANTRTRVKNTRSRNKRRR